MKKIINFAFLFFIWPLQTAEEKNKIILQGILFLDSFLNKKPKLYGSGKNSDILKIIKFTDLKPDTLLFPVTIKITDALPLGSCIKNNLERYVPFAFIQGLHDEATLSFSSDSWSCTLTIDQKKSIFLGDKNFKEQLNHLLLETFVKGPDFDTHDKTMLLEQKIIENGMVPHPSFYTFTNQMIAGYVLSTHQKVSYLKYITQGLPSLTKKN
ncbi:MAG: hypothetical protein AB7R69_03070 [Candidatus Babeliales bacterium]